MKQRWRWLLLCGIALCGISSGSVQAQHRTSQRAVAVPAASPLDPKTDPQLVAAPSYVLMDAETGRVLASHNMHERRAPASTTKTMTALLCIEKGDLDRVVTISANPPKIGESSIALQKGEQLTLYQLLEAALIHSANDSCLAIAEGVAGSESKFVAMMNARARQLGANDTHFVNPHGLNDPQHYTSAYDLALIARAAMQHEVFRRIVNTHEATIPGNAKVGPVRKFRNRNRLLFRWAEADGIKTGYTRQAGRCLIASASRIDPATNRPWRLIGVVMHSPDSWSDSANLLIRHGFEKYKLAVMVRGGEELARVPIEGGSASAIAVAAREIRLPVRPWERDEITSHVTPLERTAPIREGQPVAWLEWRLHDKKIASVPLVAREAVAQSLAVKAVPAIGPLIPSQPIFRWSVYLLTTAALFFLLAGWKVRINERKRKRKTRARR